MLISIAFIENGKFVYDLKFNENSPQNKKMSAMARNIEHKCQI